MNNLHRELAPISSEAWREIDKEAARTLRLKLAGRKLVDFVGPLGPKCGAVNTGRVHAIAAGPVENVTAARREVLPLVQLQSDFVLSRAELDAVERGSADPDLEAVKQAASRIAHAEDAAIFHGYAAGGIAGMSERSPHAAIAIPKSYDEYPKIVAEAIRILRVAGVEGPYALALGTRCFEGLSQATDDGYPVLKVVKNLIEGPVVWAPAVNGAIALSMRGGDFELTVGRDLSVGYRSHDSGNVHLYLTETVTFRVLTAEAAV
ncbi:MAG: family 1 encapsulin nanocompartment shell protein, partial [Thermodesulfobacteriota bacterium]